MLGEPIEIAIGIAIEKHSSANVLDPDFDPEKNVQKVTTAQVSYCFDFDSDPDFDLDPSTPIGLASTRSMTSLYPGDP